MTLFQTGQASVERGTGRRVSSLALSGALHASLAMWLVAGAAPEDRRTLYEREIAPHRDKIVWYNLRERLPEVSPTDAEEERRPLKAEKKAPQTIVSRAPDRVRGEQTIWLPEPRIENSPAVQSPNVLAFSPREPRPVRDFKPPASEKREARASDLPAAPEIASAIQPSPVQQPAARPTRDFAAPRTESRPAPALPDAPVLAGAPGAPPISPEISRPRPRAFTVPVQPRTVATIPLLPAAPEAAASVSAPPLAPNPARPVRDFVAGTRAPARPTEALPDAPELRAAAGATGASTPAGLPGPARPSPRAFTPPPGNASGTGAPSSIPEPPAAAVVGLNPSAALDVPNLPGARQVEFSAGPVVRPEGAAPGGSKGAAISVPGLTVRQGPRDAEPTLVARLTEAPTSERSLAAATRSAPPKAVEPPPETPARPAAVRVSSAPDPRLEGRIVYSIAVQMPNVTSYSGSWILWFAERERLPGAPPDMRPPLPLRKVDPKYIAAAAAERVEGRVRLAAVIRRTGRVEAVALLQGIDTRLDRSAEEALSKWEFEPALRNGHPVDVDAVVEIPFRLAPRTSK